MAAVSAGRIGGVASWGFLIFFSVFSFSLSAETVDFKSSVHSKLREDAHFDNPVTCKGCHQLQYDEWEGSAHQYSSMSPVFRALDLVTQKGLNVSFPRNPTEPTRNFCNKCHSPLTDQDTSKLETAKVAFGTDSIHFQTQSSVHGVSCVTCHSMAGVDSTKVQKFGAKFGFAQAGVGNNQFLLTSTLQTLLYFGPSSADPKNPAQAKGIHTQKGFGETNPAKFFKSAQFCFTCHQVNFPGIPNGDGNVFFSPLQKDEELTPHKQLFRPEQNLVVEYLSSPWAKGTAPGFEGQTISCQDCHMSKYPYGKPGEYVQAQIATQGRVRDHAFHGFTGATNPLLPGFPNINNPEKSETYPHAKGTVQRRADLLKKAVTMKVLVPRSSVALGASHLPIDVILNNTGAGHNVPSGFSQERETWLNFVVETEDGKIVYQSGFLRGQKEDEIDGRMIDLQDEYHKIDAENAESIFSLVFSKMGPDYNIRPLGNEGLASLKNKFLRKLTGLPGKNVKYREDFAQFLPVEMDNTRSLEPFKPLAIRYDVPMDKFYRSNPNYKGDFVVKVRLRYRSFPPKFLRVLAKRHPNLIGEKTIQMNPIIDMAEASTVVKTDKEQVVKETASCPPAGKAPTYEDGARAFVRPDSGDCWVFFHGQKTYTAAKAACERLGCKIASAADYGSLKLDTYKPSNEDNKEMLGRSWWTRDESRVADGEKLMRTYHFLSGGRGDEKLGEAKTTDTRFFNCACR